MSEDKECDDCGTKLICPYCKKECKTKSGLVNHMKYCVLKQTPIELPEEIEHEKVLTKREAQKQFINSFGGRRAANKYDIDRVFEIFKDLFPQSTVHMDWTCSQCVTQIYNRVKQVLNG